MTQTPPYVLARYETVTTVKPTNPAALEPVNGGTSRNPRPMHVTEVNIRTRDGAAATVDVTGRRVLKRDAETGSPGSGGRHYQAFSVRDDVIQPAWGEVDPPQWMRDMYDAWRTGNLVDGRP